METRTIDEYIQQLSSESPSPGGGGVAALTGALSASLCSMILCITRNKKSFENDRKFLDTCLEKTITIRNDLEAAIKKDEECFEPLSKAYAYSKDAPDRDKVINDALESAVKVPLQILNDCVSLSALLIDMKGRTAKLLDSDMAISATLTSATMKAAIVTIFTNVKLMKDREKAEKLMDTVKTVENSIIPSLDKLYSDIKMEMI